MTYNPQNPNGQATSANSAPVVIASDQSAVPVSAASLPLPTGAATAANQTTANTSLSTISTAQTSGSQKTQVVDGSGNIIGSTSNALDVNIKSGASSNTQYAEATIAATATGTVAMGKSGTTVKAVQTDTNGNLRVDISQTSANATALKVDGSAVTQPVSGSATGSAVPANAFYVAGKDTSGNLQGLSTANANADATGASNVLASASWLFNGTNWDRRRSGGVTGMAGVSGDTANAATDAGNPLKIGGVGKTANPTAVSDGQRVNATFDKLGKQVVVNSIRDLKGIQQTTITSSTAETTIVTQVAATFLDLYSLILTNTSATGTKVTIKDSTAGTTRAVFYVPANETRGFTLTESAAMPQSAVNNNWTATCGTSVASLEVTALFVKNT